MTRQLHPTGTAHAGRRVPDRIAGPSGLSITAPAQWPGATCRALGNPLHREMTHDPAAAGLDAAARDIARTAS